MRGDGQTTAGIKASKEPCFPVATLRVSVTDRCNLRCAYCMPAGGVQLVGRDQMLNLEELFEAISWINDNKPLQKIKITGGEPLVRRGLSTFIASLSTLDGEPEISMTSNGILLGDHAAELKGAGLARVNISLDSLDPERFNQLTRGGSVEQVLQGIATAREFGLCPIKLNSVLRRSSFKFDVPELLDFAAKQGVVVRFLELMRTGTERGWSESELVSAKEVRRWLVSVPGCEMPGYGLDHGSEPARREKITWRGEELEIGWILPQSQPFCSACDRLRIDAQGRLRRCLMDPVTLDFKELRSSGHNKLAALENYLAGKRAPLAMDNALPMASLGG